MRKLRYRTLSAFTASILFGVLPSSALSATNPSSTFPEDPRRGSLVFAEKLCFLCHAIHGYGNPQRGPDLSKTPHDMGFPGIAGIIRQEQERMLKISHEKTSRPILARALGKVLSLSEKASCL